MLLVWYNCNDKVRFFAPNLLVPVVKPFVHVALPWRPKKLRKRRRSNRSRCVLPCRVLEMPSTSRPKKQKMLEGNVKFYERNCSYKSADPLKMMKIFRSKRFCLKKRRQLWIALCPTTPRLLLWAHIDVLQQKVALVFYPNTGLWTADDVKMGLLGWADTHRQTSRFPFESSSHFPSETYLFIDLPVFFAFFFCHCGLIKLISQIHRGLGASPRQVGHNRWASFGRHCGWIHRQASDAQRTGPFRKRNQWQVTPWVAPCRIP